MKSLKSLQLKLGLLIVFAILCSITSVSTSTSNNVQKEINELTQDYLMDVAKYTGKQLEGLGESGLSQDTFNNIFKGVKIADMSTSYAYVVGADGTMYYHPTADKIGKTVENEQ